MRNRQVFWIIYGWFEAIFQTASCARLVISYSTTSEFLVFFSCLSCLLSSCFLSLLFVAVLVPQAETRKETKENFPEEEILKIFMTSSSLLSRPLLVGTRLKKYNKHNIFYLYLPASTYSGAINKKNVGGAAQHTRDVVWLLIFLWIIDLSCWSSHKLFA